MTSPTCKGKFSYATQRLAKIAMEALIRRKAGKAPPGRMNIFACHDCGGFHIGHARRHLLSRPKRGGDRIRAKLTRYKELLGGEA